MSPFSVPAASAPSPEPGPFGSAGRVRRRRIRDRAARDAAARGRRERVARQRAGRDRAPGGRAVRDRAGRTGRGRDLADEERAHQRHERHDGRRLLIRQRHPEHQPQRDGRLREAQHGGLDGRAAVPVPGRERRPHAQPRRRDRVDRGHLGHGERQEERRHHLHARAQQAEDECRLPSEDLHSPSLE
ncbi:hypothetical protein ETD85_61005 [Nonomuraea zeae]|uniref:Uncharacterized protein n=1 Tax=Nonomuraea zeae TaxID=1642303 RepID=A0A5S4F206_9ACTN|nr:hypothetical protein ETD85_61005 [Nonomuraea zeae]